MRVSVTAGVTCEDDGVEAGFAPQLHEVNHIPEAQRRVTGEHDARLPELVAEVSVNAGIVLQFVGLNQLQVKDMTSVHHVDTKINVHPPIFCYSPLNPDQGRQVCHNVT